MKKEDLINLSDPSWCQNRIEYLEMVLAQKTMRLTREKRRSKLLADSNESHSAMLSAYEKWGRDISRIQSLEKVLYSTIMTINDLLYAMRTDNAGWCAAEVYINGCSNMAKAHRILNAKDHQSDKEDQ